MNFYNGGDIVRRKRAPDVLLTANPLIDLRSLLPAHESARERAIYLIQSARFMLM